MPGKIPSLLLIAAIVTIAASPDAGAQSSPRRYIAPRFTRSRPATLLNCQSGCDIDCDCADDGPLSVFAAPTRSGVPTTETATIEVPLALPVVPDAPVASAETTENAEVDSLSAPPSISIERRRREKMQQYEELREAIKRRLLEGNRRAPQPPSPAETEIVRRSTGAEIGVPHADPAAPLPPGIPPRIEVALPTEPTEPPQQAPAIALQPVPPADATTAESPDDVNSEHRDLFGLDGIPLVDGPVDRVALGDNFYAEKEFAIALRMYSEVRLNDLPVDQQYWVQFQQASCLRRLGDGDAARKIYRILAGRRDGGWLAGVSTWWLNRMEERAQLEDQIGRMDAHLAELKESWNEPEDL